MYCGRLLSPSMRGAWACQDSRRRRRGPRRHRGGAGRARARAFRAPRAGRSRHDDQREQRGYVLAAVTLTGIEKIAP